MLEALRRQPGCIWDVRNLVAAVRQGREGRRMHRKHVPCAFIAPAQSRMRGSCRAPGTVLRASGQGTQRPALGGRAAGPGRTHSLQLPGGGAVYSGT